MSHTNFSDPNLNDNFTIAKQVSRLHLFNPKFELSTVDTSGEPGDSVTLPIYVSDVTDLNITSIKTNICFDSNILTPVNIITQGTFSEIWEDSEYTISDTGLALSLKGETALSGQGVLCYIKFKANPNSENNDSTDILFKNISILEKGPKVQSKNGSFNIKTQTHVNNDIANSNKKFILHSNYPNPFNAGTSISYQLFSPCHVNLQIYNSLGQLVQVIINESQHTGDYNLHWGGRNFENMEVPSGLYFYVFKADDYKIVNKMILLR